MHKGSALWVFFGVSELLTLPSLGEGGLLLSKIKVNSVLYRKPQLLWVAERINSAVSRRHRFSAVLCYLWLNCSSPLPWCSLSLGCRDSGGMQWCRSPFVARILQSLSTWLCINHGPVQKEAFLLGAESLSVLSSHLLFPFLFFFFNFCFCCCCCFLCGFCV